MGIDLAAGRGITEVAVLHMDDGDSHPVFDAGSHQRVATDAEIVAAVVVTQPAVIAIDAPLTLPRAVMRGLLTARTAGTSGEGPFEGGGAPLAAPALASAVDGYTAASSPYTRAAERDPLWSALGIRPFPVSFLGGLTFRAISLLPHLRAAAPMAAIIEVFPSATLRQLGISKPERGKRPPKTARESRRSAQLSLSMYIEGIADPEDSLYGADLLDALAAALTGISYLHNDFQRAGDVAEGTIILLGSWPIV
ncbi:MAG: DUF429 domain-containing protein [Ktedonobacterales bacterium]